MWSNLVSAALLYGVLSTTIVVAQFGSGAITGITSSPNPAATDPGSGGRSGPDRTDSVDKGPAATSSTLGSAAPSAAPNETQESDSVSTSPSGTNSPKASGANGMGVSSGDAGIAPPKSVQGGKSNTGAIAGGVVGGVLFLVLVGALIFFLRKRKRARDPFGSVEKSADGRAANNESPSPRAPAPIAAASASPHPHHSPTSPNEALALMSHYGDAQPQHMPQEVQPVIMPAKPYDVDPSSREIRDVDEDDDGVSINSPSPVTTPSPERQQEQQRSVPRLPIYQGGRKDDAGGNTPPPAL